MGGNDRSTAPHSRAGLWKRVGLVAAVLAVTVVAVVVGWRALSADPEPRTPDAVPSVVLTQMDRDVWVPGPPNRAEIPVLLYHGIAPANDFSNEQDALYGLDPGEFAKQMVMLDRAEYETVSLDEFVRFHRGEDVDLPAHPLLLTFDDARADSWTGGDAILQELGFSAVMFVDVGRVDGGDPEYLTWEELEIMQSSGRWEMQLHSGEGHQVIRYGPGPDDFGAFYAYQMEDETFDEWRVRVFEDITGGQEKLAENILNFRPLAFAPPYGNYGQDGTNNPRIPEVLLPWLVDRFGIVFTQQDDFFTIPREPQPLGRLQLTRAMTGGQLHERLTEPRPG